MTTWKLRVHDAVINSKLLYGLESASLTNAEYERLDAFQVNSRTRPCTGAQTACPHTQSATHVPRVGTVQAVLLAWRCRCTQNLPLPHRITRAKQVSYTHSLPQCVLESLMKFQRIAQAMPQRYLLHVAAMPERYAQCAAV